MFTEKNFECRLLDDIHEQPQMKMCDFKCCTHMSKLVIKCECGFYQNVCYVTVYKYNKTNCIMFLCVL